MSYFLKNERPYYYDDKQYVYPCAISADFVSVDFQNPMKVNPKKFNVPCFYTEGEVKHRLGIFMIDSWDNENQCVVKVSNKTVSSIPEEKETETDKKEEKDKDKTKEDTKEN